LEKKFKEETAMEERFIQYFQSPFGLLQLRSTATILLNVKWVVEKDEEETVTRPILDQAAQQLDDYFKGERKSFNLSIEPRGTVFQQKVWNVLRKIPYGQIWTYQDVANAIDSPKAPRAVGRANNKNPLAIIIPCHRVIGTNGLLTGYAGGLEIKKDLMDLEKKQLIKELNLLQY
jgi:methylated-DNA-[protein]-cysteine S-methyltransferase